MRLFLPDVGAQATSFQSVEGGMSKAAAVLGHQAAKSSAISKTDGR